MKTLKPLFVFLITASMFMTTVSQSQAVQPSPSSFYGTVKINGSNVPAGTSISAWIKGIQYVSAATTRSNGKTDYRLDIPGDDPEKVGNQGGKEGDAIIFQFNPDRSLGFAAHDQHIITGLFKLHAPKATGVGV